MRWIWVLVLGAAMAVCHGQTIAPWRVATTAWASNYVRGEAAGKGEGGALVFDGATAGTRVSGGSFATLGSGSFTVWLRFRVPAFLPTGVSAVAVGGVSASGTALGVSDAAYLRLSSDGAATFRLTDGGGVNRDVAVAGFLAAQGGKVVDVFLVRDAEAATGALWLGTKLRGSGTTGWGSSVAATVFHLGNLDGSSIFNGEVYRAALFNLALTAADMAEVAAAGIPDRLRWGSAAAVYASDFSAGSDGWSPLNGTQTGNTDGVSDGTTSKNDTLRFYADGTSGRHGVTKSGILAAGKGHRATWEFYVPAGNTTALGSRLGQATGWSALADSLATGVWSSGSKVFTATETGLAFGELTAAGADTFSGANSAANDRLYLKNVTVWRVGAILDWDCGAGIGYQAADRGPLKAHGLAAGGVSHRAERRFGQVRGQTSTSGNQQLTGGVCLPANGRIVNIAASAAGTATVNIGNASGGSQIASGFSVASGRQDVGSFASRYSSTGNVWINSTTGTAIDWTIFYEVVD